MWSSWRTDSFTAKTFDKLKLIIELGINVISTAEEMSYPKAKEPKLAAEIDRIAKANGVSVLGTGINPGLMMDLLVILMTGACTDVEYVKAERVNSLSPFGPAVMEEQGVGITLDEFNKQSAAGHLAGPRGLQRIRQHDLRRHRLEAGQARGADHGSHRLQGPPQDQVRRSAARQRRRLHHEGLRLR